MKRILATCAGGLLAAAAVCHAASADPVVHGPENGAASRDWGSISPVSDAEPADAETEKPDGPLGPTRTVVAGPAEGSASQTPPPAAVSLETTGSVPEPSGHAGSGESSKKTEASGGEAAHQAAEPEATRSPMPFDITRTLQFLQDQIARGNGRAIRVQAMLLRRFAPAFLDADHQVWTDRRNRRAAILFTLSGGPPDVLRRLLAANAFDDATKVIAEGALAYVSNDLDKAETLLSSANLAGVEPGLAAHLNLVLGQLKQRSHPASAVAYLGKARLLAPGGLIEEAALRLEVVVVDGLGDHAGADRLARQYFDRFSSSSYAGNFRSRFAMVYADRGAVDGARALATVLDITARLDPADRRALLLAVSRRSLLAGNLDFARASGAEALKSDGIAGEELQRGNLYAAAAGLGAQDRNGVAAELQAVDRSLLHPADVGLLDAANTVLSRIEDPALANDPSIEPAAVAPLPVFDRAQKLLDAVAGDLGEKSE